MRERRAAEHGVTIYEMVRDPKLYPLESYLDAADQLETGEGTAAQMGIYPQLSALEMLVYPKSAAVVANAALLAAGAAGAIAAAFDTLALAYIIDAGTFLRNFSSNFYANPVISQNRVTDS